MKKDHRKNEDVAVVELEEETTAPPENAFKDELNLAEFPIAALTDRVPDGQTTLVFEDRLDQRDGPPIVRRLTIMAPSKHGLPAAVDDEVIVGLIQLTKRRNNFTDPKVSFSRYELIELLGWPQTGPSYRRVEEALHRWVGVVLMYENAWWDNAAKSWVDENFHILENVSLYDRERRKLPGKSNGKSAGARRGRRGGGDPLPLSSFRWNEVIFRSFQSGNLKQLDLEFYLGLRLPTTKRMFRFLDKRFYRCDRLDFDLKTLACEHIGMSRSYKPTELKRRLKPALDELELLGFLEPLEPEERYSWQARGQWRILLIRGPLGRAEIPVEPAAEAASLIEALVARGVTSKTAKELVEAHPPSRVRTKLEVFDWLIKNEDKRVGKNPAGYLVASIRSDYQAPGDFQGIKQTNSAAEARQQTATAERERRSQARAEAEAEAEREARLRARWEELSAAVREAITAKVKAENPGLKRWKAMIEPLCLAELGRRLEAGDLPSGASSRRQPSLFPDSKAK